MTTICAGGPSEPRPGIQILQNMSAAGIAEYLLGEGMGWLADLAYGVGYLAYDLSGLCTTDPPALPTVDAARVFGYTNPLNPQGAAQLRQDITAIIGHYLWFQYCQCTTGTTPGPPGPLVQPTGQQTDNPQALTIPAGDCGTRKERNIAQQADVNGNVTILNPLPDSNVAPNGQWYFMHLQVTDQGTNQSLPYNVNCNVVQLDSTGAAVQQNSFIVPPGPYPGPSFTNTINPRCATYRFDLHADITTQPTWSITLDCRQYCTAPPASALPACCPPDPNLIALINQVLQLENEILNDLKPPSKTWTTGTVHTGISGTGSFNIAQGVTGIRANFTTIPPDIQTTPGTPTFYWSLGFVTPLAMTYPLRSLRTVFQLQDLPLPIQADGIAYTFPPGVVVTLTELLPA